MIKYRMVAVVIHPIIDKNDLEIQIGHPPRLSQVNSSFIW